MTIGAIAELKITGPAVMENPVLHRIPARIMQERAKVDAAHYQEAGR